MPLKTKPETVRIGDNPLRCLVCGHPEFHRRRIRLELALVSDLNPEWMSCPGHSLICAQCGHVHGFAER